MANLTDITNVSDAVLDAFLAAKGGDECVDCDHLTSTERRQLADLMGWERTAFLSAWIADAPAPKAPRGPDYEGAILARQEADESRWT